jgi:hypothetical protein
VYRNLPKSLKREIGEHDITILKGDVNLRRLIDERHWGPTTPIEKAGGYFPTPFLSLRTLKSELILGLSEKTYKELEAKAEKDWLINGKRGMILFYQ